MHELTRRTFSAGSVLAGVLVGNARALARQISGPDLPADDEIRKTLAARIDALSAGRNSIGMVAGVIGPQGRKVVAMGYRDKGDTRTLSGDTAFEFGSVAKVFTALLLADMVVHREVSLGDPVSKYLPKTVKLPERDGRRITLVDLATHMSGLPFMPVLPVPPGGTAFTAAEIYKFLATYSLPREPGSDWDYSNLGYWLLSEALAARAQMKFTTLLTERILAPLNLAHSGFTPTADVAIGHNSALQPAPRLADVPIYNLMPAAGAGFYATADDALTFLAAAMGYTASLLAPAFALSVDTHRPIRGSTDLQALGWTLIDADGSQLIFSDGGTFGFASCLVWDRAKRVGTVVLANCVTDVSDIGKHILRPDFTLAKPAPAILHREIPLDAATIARYAGRYAAAGEGTFTIALEGGHLTFTAPPDWGLAKLRLRPESKQDFFAAELALRVTFQTRKGGGAIGMTIYPPRGQKGLAAKKIG
jgi:D-alanyl-D-alanine-carboxypeptidase/D-alanyl-D-alanine-endopeptidase